MNLTSLQIIICALGGEKPAGTWDLVSLGMFTVMVSAVLALLMFMATWLGRRRASHEKDMPYESGVEPTGSAKFRFPVQFYLVAIFFIIFDLEAVFIYSWAVSFDILGWPGFFYISFFIAALMAGLVYVWKKKGLEWGPEK